jgi:hypothetical protein
MAMKEADIRAQLVLRGWSEDRYGSMRKSLTVDGETRDYRVKFNDISCRYEVQTGVLSDGTRHWIRIGGGYYSDSILFEDGRMRLGKATMFKAPEAP